MSSTRTCYLLKETTVADASGVSVGNAVTEHTDIGKTTYGWLFRAFIKADLDLSGIDVDNFVSAILRVKVTSGLHITQGGSIRLKFKRCDESFSATGGHAHGTGDEFRADANEDWDSGNAVTLDGTTYDDIASDPSPSAGAWVDFDISDLVRDYLEGKTNNGMRVWSYDETAGNDAIEWYSMRSSYEPRVILTYESVGAFGVATSTAPLNGAVLEAAPSTLDFTFADSSPSVAAITAYDLQVGTSPGGSTVLNVSNQTTGITGRTVSLSTAGIVWPPGAPAVPVWVRARAKNSIGTYGAWGQWSFVIKNPPNAPTLISPTVAKPYAKVNNLGALAIWTANEAKPEVQFTYSHPDGYGMVAAEVNLGGTTTSYAVSAADGATVTLAVTTAMARATNTSIQVRVQAVGGQWSAWTTVFNCKVQWAQGLYSYTHPGGASDFAFDTAALAGGAYTQMAAIFRKGDGSPGAWKATIGEVTPSTQMDILVRLATGDSAQAPSLPDMTLSFNATPEPAPDDFTATNATLTIDSTKRRYGRRSIKVAPSGAGNVRPTAAIAVTPGTEYTWSLFVNTNGATLAQHLVLKVCDSAGTVLFTAGADGDTADSSAAVDGWQRLTMTFTPAVNSVLPEVTFAGTVAQFNIDSAQLEEGPRATQWRPGATGQAVSLDIGGIQVDASLGAVVRLRGSTGGVRDVVTLSAHGLTFADVEVSSAAAGVLDVGGVIHMPTDGQVIMEERATDPATPAANEWGLYIKPAGLYLIDDAGAVTFIGGQGSAFPTGVTGQRFWRTDLHQSFYYDGTRWLSETLYEREFTDYDNLAQPYTATAPAAMRTALPGAAIYLVDIVTSYFVVTGGTALGASHKWVLTHTTDPGATLLATQSIASGASATWLQVANLAINTVIAATQFEFFMAATKTGTPGNLRCYPLMRYRTIAT